MIRLFSTTVLLALPAIASAQSVSAQGVCPGSVTIDVSGVTPGGIYAVVTSNVGGSTVVPVGGCAGNDINLGLSGGTLRATPSADGGGNDTLSPVVPEGGCGLYLAVLDMTSCVSSPSIRLPLLNVDAYEARLDGAQLVPAVVTNASGLLTATVDATDNMTWDLNANSFTNTFTTAHFHNAPAGQNGGVMFGIGGDITQNGTDVAGSGAWAMTGPDRTELDTGAIYVNVHSDVNGGGEIRGQMLPVTLLSAILDGDQITPTVPTAASGTATMSLDQNDVLSWSVTIANLTSTMTNAHFHVGAAGTNGGVAFGIFGDLTQVGTDVTGSGTWAMSGGDVANLLAGDLYINIHTNAFGGGELRGQALTD